MNENLKERGVTCARKPRSEILQSSGRDLNSVPSAYEAGMVKLRCSVVIC